MRRRREKYAEVRKQIRRLARRSRFWRAVLRYIELSKRRQKTVNIYKLNRVAAPSDKVLVVGKLLGVGKLNHPLTVVAFDFSDSAYRKVSDAGGTAMYLSDFLKKGQDASGFKIIA